MPAGLRGHRTALEATGVPGAPPHLYLISPSADTGSTLLARLPKGVSVFDSAADFMEGHPAGEGVIFLAPDVDRAEVVALLLELGRLPGPWAPVLLREAKPPSTSSGGSGDASAGEGDDMPPQGDLFLLEAHPLSLGYPEPVDELLARLRSGDLPGRAPLLELRSVLHEVAWARHDINNPLTTAMAETQLLLMDVDEEEARAALEAVERALRTIRDLVGSLSRLRPPPPADRDS